MLGSRSNQNKIIHFRFIKKFHAINIWSDFSCNYVLRYITRIWCKFDNGSVTILLLLSEI